MPDDQNDLARLVARVSLLQQIVRMMLRESLIADGKGASDVLAYAEEVKRFFEDRLPKGQAEMRMTAEVDGFFNALASDLRDRGNP